MSKFVKVSDVKQTLLEMSKEKTRPVGWGDVLMERLKDLSIEVSEDCISREWVKGICENMLDEEMLGHMLGYIKNAPSVVPRLDKEDLEDIYEHISESYVEGYMDGQADGVNAIGDCNICRFAGCSECDDCINGSQWVRMTKGDEE